MSISDPFSTTYAGAYKSGSALGEGIGTLAQEGASVLKQKQAYNTLKAAGMIKENVTPPSDDELKKGLEEAAKKNGIHQLSFMESDDPAENRKGLENAYKSLGIPLPTGKRSIEYNLAPGTEYKVNDNLVMKGKEKQQGIVEQMTEFAAAQKMLEKVGLGDTAEVVTDGKGRQTIKKTKRDVAAEKFDVEQEDAKKQQEVKSQGFISSADDLLNTISKVKEGKENFGWKSFIPGMPESEKLVWDKNMNKLLAKQVLNVIADMKNTSKTGATGFGSLNQPELKVITDGATELDRKMSYKDAEPILARMENAVNKIKERENGNREGVGTGNQGYSVGQVIEQGGKKYKITGGDPNDPDVEEIQ